MAQTKRKRRTKHRGTAAGTIQTRGRPSSKPDPDSARKSRSGARAARQLKPPSWQGALTKAALMALLLFVLTRVGLFGKNVPIAQSAALCLFAVVFYTPLAYVTDKWVYARQQKRLAEKGG